MIVVIIAVLAMLVAPNIFTHVGALWQTPSGEPAPNWKGPYLRKAVPADPWGRPYVYVASGPASNPAVGGAAPAPSGAPTRP